MKKLKCEVLIVGGGVAGATAARELNKLRIDNILIEKDLSFKKPCGGGLVKIAFDEFDIPKSLIKKEVKSIEIISSSGLKANVDISKYPLAIVNRQEFDAKLRELAKDSGTKIINAKAYDIEIKEKIRLFAKSSKESLLIECKYLIAADGINSLVRKKALKETPSRILTYYADINENSANSCKFYFGKNLAPNCYGWLFPHFKGVNIGICSSNEKEIDLYFKNFAKSLGFSNNIKAKGYYLANWKSELYFKDNIFYIGDSASLVLPFTYEGIYYAMKSAKLASLAIAKNNPSFYKESWHKLYYKKFRFLQISQKIFLQNDYIINKMVKLFNNKRFANSAVEYWIGNKKALSKLETIKKAYSLLKSV